MLLSTIHGRYRACRTGEPVSGLCATTLVHDGLFLLDIVQGEESVPLTQVSLVTVHDPSAVNRISGWT